MILKTILILSVIPEKMSRSTSNIDAGENLKILCSYQKDGVLTVQLMILSLIRPLRKYILDIIKDGSPMVQLMVLNLV